MGVGVWLRGCSGRAHLAMTLLSSSIVSNRLWATSRRGRQGRVKGGEQIEMTPAFETYISIISSPLRVLITSVADGVCV